MGGARPARGGRGRAPALLVLIGLLLSACQSAPRLEPRSLPVPTAPAASPTAAAAVSLPRDDAPHDQLSEWWYYTGHLDAASGASYGFELVVFQSIRGRGPVGYAAHYAITDQARGRFVYDQRTAVGSQIGKADSFDLALGDWRMRGSGGRDQLSASLPGYAIDLALQSQKPAALHDQDGLVSFGPAGDSYYYSRTRMDVAGSIAIDGRAEPVTGLAWFDHQWGRSRQGGTGSASSSTTAPRSSGRSSGTTAAGRSRHTGPTSTPRVGRPTSGPSSSRPSRPSAGPARRPV